MNTSQRLLSKAIQLTNIPQRTFEINECELPPLQPDQIAISVITSTIDTLDYKKILGKVPNLPLPFTPGLEVFGRVIETGSEAQDLAGKMVAAWTFDGAAKTIAISNRRRAIVLEGEIDEAQASLAFINPLTVLGLLSFHKPGISLINNSANSSLGKMLSRVCQFHKIPLINIVRSESKLQELKSEDNEHVLDSSSPSFLSELEKLASSLNAKIFFDSVAGNLSGEILKAMPAESSLIVYGNISGQPLGNIDAGDFRWKKKSVDSFFIPSWILSISEEEAEKKKKFVSDYFSQLFSVKIAGKYQPTQYKEAFEEYANDTSAGKRVIYFQ